MKTVKLITLLLLIMQGVFSQSFLIADEGNKVSFSIKNFGIKTTGNFTGLKGNIAFNPKALSTSMFNVSVNAATVNTGNNSRDKHLRKSEYFDVEKFALIKFVSTIITASSTAGHFLAEGNLTIKGITKKIQFGFSATAVNSGYNFKGDFEINRRNFGVGGSSISLADNLKVMLDVTAKK